MVKRGMGAIWGSEFSPATFSSARPRDPPTHKASAGRHPGPPKLLAKAESGDPVFLLFWIPAFAGMSGVCADFGSKLPPLAFRAAALQREADARKSEAAEPIDEPRERIS